jgi:EAL domain-containing protein (putative c-di-GMP-specific phosphodiesterase class I)
VRQFDLRTALAQDQFLLHFQPQVGHDGRYVGVEALVRWHHPVRGLVPPSEFIALAEETGLILTLGRWVLHSACKLLAQWQSDALLSHLTMAVNVSSQQFHHASFVDDVARALAVNDAPPYLLKLELTESLMVEDMDITITTMTTLRSLGVRFSLDDFGTGYSSLSYLADFPIDILKIDRSFVSKIGQNKQEAIVSAMIAMGKAMGMTVVAEGIETEQQLQYLHSLDCDIAQGYLFSKPLPEAEATEYLTQNARMPIYTC